VEQSAAYFDLRVARQDGYRSIGPRKKNAASGEADRGAKIDYGEGKLELYAAGNSVTS
jgi:hypothetical protein